MEKVKIVTASEDSLQIQFAKAISEKINSMVVNFARRIKDASTKTPGIKEIVPAYCSVSVYFDLEKTSAGKIKRLVKKTLRAGFGFQDESAKKGKLVEIPVCYDEEFAPDLKDVAKNAKISEEEAVKIHSSKDYLIYMLGFLPGFPYLGGMDERLETPRLTTPRLKIPAGSVAIGGKQTGLYPAESPGGWRIIGRTPLKVFDQNIKPSCLYEAGDKIRFVPISKSEFFEIQKAVESESGAKEKLSSEEKQKPRYVCTCGIKILDGGLFTTVQDLGREGFQDLGIGQGGAMDRESCSYVNFLLNNSENAACLEATAVGPEIQFALGCDFALGGGECQATLNGRRVPMNKVVRADAGDILKCGAVSKGLRTYIGFSGGILVPLVLKSRSTNTKAKMGGLNGRKLKAGDELAIGNFTREKNGKRKKLKKLKPAPLPEISKILELKCTKSSQFDFFDAKIARQFQKTVYTVLAESDRMGIRLGGKKLDFGKTDIISDPVPFGAVQITSAGLPVVMGADRQTTGGYAKIACVTRKSICALAQASPGTKVKFKISR